MLHDPDLLSGFAIARLGNAKVNGGANGKVFTDFIFAGHNGFVTLLNSRTFCNDT